MNTPDQSSNDGTPLPEPEWFAAAPGYAAGEYLCADGKWRPTLVSEEDAQGYKTVLIGRGQSRVPSANARRMRDGATMTFGFERDAIAPFSPSNCSASVLDVCCGSRMFWFDKADPRALFVDKRRETLIDHTGPKPVSIVVNPDMLANFKALPLPDNTFALVVFDPPYTCWRNEIAAGFRECFRVLCPLGTLIFKWNEHRVKLSTVLSLTPEKPLFGQKVGNTKTHWIVYQKPNDKLCREAGQKDV